MDQHADHPSAIDSLGSELRSSFGHLREKHQARLEQLSSLMSSLQDVTKTVESDGETLESASTAALGHLEAFSTKFGDIDQKSQALQQRIDELGAALENAEREKAGLAEKLHSVESDQQALESARAELNSRNDALENLQREFDELRRVHDQEHGELESIRARARNAEEKLLNLEQEAANQSGDSKALEERIASLEAEIDAKDSALQSAQASMDAAQDDHNRMLAEFESLSQVQQQAEAAQEGMKTELLAVQREMEALREKYREGLSTDAALALRQQVTETAERAKHLESELAESRKQSKKSVLALQLTEAIQEAEQLNEENKALKQEIALLREGVMPPPTAPVAEAAPETVPFSTESTPEDVLRRIQESAKNLGHGPKRVIGQILLDAGIISDEQLKHALELQKSNPQQHLGALLTEMGFATEEAVAQARASQCGVEFIRFDESTVDPEAAALITERLAVQHSCIPIAKTDRAMVLAVTNPMDLLAIEDVERFTNKKVDVVVGTVPEIASAISRYYWEPE